VNYFPSRFDPVRNAAPTPMNKAQLSGRRERACIAKENNFQQVG
jgi:catalase